MPDHRRMSALLLTIGLMVLGVGALRTFFILRRVPRRASRQYPFIASMVREQQRRERAAWSKQVERDIIEALENAEASSL